MDRSPEEKSSEQGSVYEFILILVLIGLVVAILLMTDKMLEGQLFEWIKTIELTGG